MPNRRRIGYMPTRRHDVGRNLAQAEHKEQRADREESDSPPQGGDEYIYQQWTREQLYARAKDLGIRGRSTMTKGQLIRAIVTA